MWLLFVGASSSYTYHTWTGEDKYLIQVFMARVAKGASPPPRKNLTPVKIKLSTKQTPLKNRPVKIKLAWCIPPPPPENPGYTRDGIAAKTI